MDDLGYFKLKTFKRYFDRSFYRELWSSSWKGWEVNRKYQGTREDRYFTNFTNSICREKKIQKTRNLNIVLYLAGEGFHLRASRLLAKKRK